LIKNDDKTIQRNLSNADPQKIIRIEQEINEHTEEINTEASVKRVLTPVLWMIHEGKFDSLTTS